MYIYIYIYIYTHTRLVAVAGEQEERAAPAELRRQQTGGPAPDDAAGLVHQPLLEGLVEQGQAVLAEVEEHEHEAHELQRLEALRRQPPHPAREQRVHGGQVLGHAPDERPLRVDVRERLVLHPARDARRDHLLHLPGDQAPRGQAAREPEAAHQGLQLGARGLVALAARAGVVDVVADPGLEGQPGVLSIMSIE